MVIKAITEQLQSLFSLVICFLHLCGDCHEHDAINPASRIAKSLIRIFVLYNISERREHNLQALIIVCESA